MASRKQESRSFSKTEGIVLAGRKFEDGGDSVEQPERDL